MKENHFQTNLLVDFIAHANFPHKMRSETHMREAPLTASDGWRKEFIRMRFLLQPSAAEWSLLWFILLAQALGLLI